MSTEKPGGQVPSGYRQGIITAITVVLGFSLFFLRFWGFELPGAWNVSSAVSATLMVLSILGQFATLWRSLQLEDDESAHYRMTLRWFLASIILLLIALGLSALSYSRLIRF
jgi:hypothetical protein